MDTNAATRRKIDRAHNALYKRDFTPIAATYVVASELDLKRAILDSSDNG
jgi:hypothetical protein